jgi:hypothetical protein
VLMVDHPDAGGDTEARPVELRKLHDLVPYYAGIGDRPETIAAETVTGGCEFPENFTGYIPKARWDEYYRQRRFIKRDGRKVVREVEEDGTSHYTAYDLETSEETDVPDDLRAAIDATGEVDTDGAAEAAPEVDEEVEQRLEELGYR